MIKQYYLVLIFLLVSYYATAQKEEYPGFFVFDSKGDPTTVEKAHYLGVLDKLDDTSFQWRYYQYAGPLVLLETYKDKDLKTPHGRFSFFGADGKIDSTGLVNNGRKDSAWYHYNDSVKVYHKVLYKNGKILEVKDEATLKAERENKPTTGFAKVDLTAEYKGGEGSWRKYLEKNFRLPKRTEGLGINGTILVDFTVATDGSIKELFISRSVEYAADTEAIRLIVHAPSWQPAMRDGQSMPAYRRQPFTIQVD